MADPIDRHSRSRESTDGTADAAPAPVVEHEVVLDAPLADVWRTVTDPTELAGWFGGTVELDVRPGGGGRIVDDAGTSYEVLVTDVDAGQRVAWHWWDQHGALSSVEITIAPNGDATRVRVVERLVHAEPSPGAVSACARRWERAGARLWARVTAHAVAW
jgi:uncharacterized protein YndB with AHSA1/START domain